MSKIQHYTFFVSTDTHRVWGDVFAENEAECFELIQAMFPWITAPVKKVTRFAIDWEDARPDETQVGVVQFNSWHQHLTLLR